MTTRRRTQSTLATDTATQATPLLTDKQVMELLKVSRTGLHYLMRKDGLPYIKLGEGRCAALRFNPVSLAAWLAQNEHQATA
jgi:predicted DNA-binding transcriptional regulator AlpA